MKNNILFNIACLILNSVVTAVVYWFDNSAGGDLAWLAAVLTFCGGLLLQLVVQNVFYSEYLKKHVTDIESNFSISKPLTSLKASSKNMFEPIENIVRSLDTIAEAYNSQSTHFNTLRGSFKTIVAS